VSVTSTSSAFSSAFRFTPSVPAAMTSPPSVPSIRRVPLPKLPVNSISDWPEASAFWPGANGPPVRSITSVPAVADTSMVSVFVTVAVPHCDPSSMTFPADTESVVVSVPTETETVAVDESKVHVAAPAAEGTRPISPTHGRMRHAILSSRRGARMRRGLEDRSPETMTPSVTRA
jgi:hypothetical protein